MTDVEGTKNIPETFCPIMGKSWRRKIIKRSQCPCRDHANIYRAALQRKDNWHHPGEQTPGGSLGGQQVKCWEAAISSM